MKMKREKIMRSFLETFSENGVECPPIHTLERAVSWYVHEQRICHDLYGEFTSHRPYGRVFLGKFPEFEEVYEAGSSINFGRVGVLEFN